MAKKNIFYAQSGGVTAVINASACGVIETARQHKNELGKVYAGRNGILGALKEELIDTSKESSKAVQALYHTPGGAFGSCRYKLKSLEQNQREYERLIAVFAAHNIGYFFYNGGNDSQDTAYKVSQIGEKLGYPITCIGIPKTMDNDLPVTDNCPGFGSVAKYAAISIQEASFDVRSMCTSTQVFILEVMGRHAGWVAAASGLAAQTEAEGPHIILFPEITFNKEKFLKQVADCVKKYDFCAIVASEGIKDHTGEFVATIAGSVDAFGHKQLGGTAATLATIVKDNLGYKIHFAIADYLQRAARHVVSKTDLEQAYAAGQKAVEFAVKGMNNIMTTIIRKPGKRYSWKIGSTPLNTVANVEKFMPRDFITKNGFHITNKARTYLLPLIQGEAPPPYKNGLPDYVTLKNILVPKKLKKFDL
ncbi:MAG: 6-phosphofructokinase [Gammaproteobacteria bacterium RIFCSPHIGHO2_12_FULL_35_23]|nr:MAG: 6-phosphofructokinase [Gammaproteobacteria bacterium RIFCSPHIGHO2_12_FULL_35_23]